MGRLQVDLEDQRQVGIAHLQDSELLHQDLEVQRQVGIVHLQDLEAHLQDLEIQHQVGVAHIQNSELLHRHTEHRHRDSEIIDLDLAIMEADGVYRKEDGVTEDGVIETGMIGVFTIISGWEPGSGLHHHSHGIGNQHLQS